VGVLAVDRFPCPICKKPVSRKAPTFPFCSERCRHVDLAKWFGGDYRIPGEEGVESDESEND
jgi:Uncharacterized protein conserved in bacteria